MKKKYIEYANGYAIEMFEDLKNHPEWRGSNFTWDIFPNMVGRLARANCRLEYPNISDADADNIKKIAIEKSEQLTKML